MSIAFDFVAFGVVYCYCYYIISFGLKLPPILKDELVPLELLLLVLSAPLIGDLYLLLLVFYLFNYY